jgi:hypothetical protein
MALADDMLTKLNGLEPWDGEAILATLPVKLLREMADLQGVDSVDMSKHNAIASIMAEFYGVDPTDMTRPPADFWSDTHTNAGLAGTVPPEFAGF